VVETPTDLILAVHLRSSGWKSPIPLSCVFLLKKPLGFFCNQPAVPLNRAQAPVYLQI
jgi:hypothetical protein